MTDAELQAAATAYNTSIAIIRYGTTPIKMFGVPSESTNEPVIFQQTYPRGCEILVRIGWILGKDSGKEGDVSLPDGGRLSKFEPLHDRHAILNVGRDCVQKQGKIALPMGDLGFFSSRGLYRY